MPAWEIALSYTKVLVWPLLLMLFLFAYRREIRTRLGEGDIEVPTPLGAVRLSQRQRELATIALSPEKPEGERREALTALLNEAAEVGRRRGVAGDETVVLRLDWIGELPQFKKAPDAANYRSSMEGHERAIGKAEVQARDARNAGNEQLAEAFEREAARLRESAEEL
ncbi:hypothetical protein [Blastococcus sp. URHD0036]|uniref:hypothetical protein n=1 Tax=Blastococcus sp. URHD0036 TaxID=1380356 RepID=UPI000494F5F0|nr:hypothetical protein [Blastococcus sp. URHD0036]